MEDKLLWTPSTIALWNDKKFLEKRIDEQKKYLEDLSKRKSTMTIGRYRDLFMSAIDVELNFENRLRELKGLPRFDKMWAEKKL